MTFSSAVQAMKEVLVVRYLQPRIVDIRPKKIMSQSQLSYTDSSKHLG